LIILGIECASLVASVALTEDGKLLSERSLHDKRTHSETLLPMVEEVLKEANRSLNQVDYVAVSAGPGSFTGLRIGATTGKGLAYTLNKPMVSVPTLDAMGYGLSIENAIFCPLFDARRSQVYTGLYTREDNRFEILLEGSNISIEEMKTLAEAEAVKAQKKVVYFGDGLLTYGEYLQSYARKEDQILLGEEGYQHAAPVCFYAEKLIAEGKIVSAMDFLPIYLRKSQAEQEREAMGLSTAPADLTKE